MGLKRDDIAVIVLDVASRRLQSKYGTWTRSQKVDLDDLCQEFYIHLDEQESIAKWIAQNHPRDVLRGYIAIALDDWKRHHSGLYSPLSRIRKSIRAAIGRDKSRIRVMQDHLHLIGGECSAIATQHDCVSRYLDTGTYSPSYIAELPTRGRRDTWLKKPDIFEFLHKLVDTCGSGISLSVLVSEIFDRVQRISFESQLDLPADHPDSADREPDMQMLLEAVAQDPRKRAFLELLLDGTSFTECPERLKEQGIDVSERTLSRWRHALGESWHAMYTPPAEGGLSVSPDITREAQHET